ncbi:LOW QUALITY PROTEIN: hypothetical protein MSG28_009078 [Choristoneura fumiferana]|uniref:Uncharacterized protein n=1 Tax=Choristoneura fumiferana TaxID=7141 RepID=A0ACC0KWN1_CHOFU|nr:LOW QUALITY PROTEIN: hypothetical protein MSG28_009078 [Choristoneura fumiferana]
MTAVDAGLLAGGRGPSPSPPPLPSSGSPLATAVELDGGSSVSLLGELIVHHYHYIIREKQIRTMSNEPKTPELSTVTPQCQFFVQRKKRLCRMTVKPGRRYCGEHEPQPATEAGEVRHVSSANTAPTAIDSSHIQTIIKLVPPVDKRIPCPNDPKHTCYASKLVKHLAICNARRTEQPAYIVENINAPEALESCARRPLSAVPRDELIKLIDKINHLYAKYLEDHITMEPPQPIHHTVAGEFAEPDRTESSLRHLRQTSALLWLAEREGLVQDNTCYVELGAGKGQLSYYACHAWCGAGRGRVLAVARAPLRHKRDNKLRSRPPPPGGATAGMQRVSVSGQLSYYACHAWCGAGRGRVLAVDRAPLRHKRDNKLRSRPPPPPPPGAPLPGCSGSAVILRVPAWCGAGRGRVLAVDRAPLRHKRDNKLRSRPPPPGGATAGMQRVSVSGQLSYYACHAWCGAGRGRVLAVDRAPLRHKRDNKLRSRPPPPPPPGGATAGMQRVSVSGQLSYYACHAWCGAGRGRVLAVDRAPLRHKRDNKLRSRPPPPGGATAGMQRVSVSGQLSYYACHAWCGAGRGRVLAVDRAPLRHKRDNKLRSRPLPPGGATAGMQRVSVSGQLSYYACHAWCGAGAAACWPWTRAAAAQAGQQAALAPAAAAAARGRHCRDAAGQLSYYACHAWCGAGRGRVLAVDRAPLRHKRDNKLRSRPPPPGGRHCRDAAGQLSYYACHAWCGAGRGRVLAVDRAPLRHKRDNKLRSRARRRQGAPLPGCSGQLSYYACHAWCGAGAAACWPWTRAAAAQAGQQAALAPAAAAAARGATAGMQRVSVSGQLSYYACHAWCGAGRGRVLAWTARRCGTSGTTSCARAPPPPGGATAGMQRVSVSGQLSYYACHAWCGAGRGRVLAVDRAPLRHKRDNKLRSRPPPPGGATAGMQRVSVSGQLSYYACHAWCGAGRGRVLAVDRAPLRHKRDNKLRSRPPPPPPPGGHCRDAAGQLSYYACHAWCGAGRGRVLAVDRAPLRHKRDNKLRSRPPPPGGATAGMQRVSVSAVILRVPRVVRRGRGRVLAVDRAPLRHKRDNKLRSRPPPPPPPGGATAGMQRVSVSGQLSYYACHAWCGAGRGRVLAVDRAPLRHKRDNKLRSRPPPPGGATAGMQRVSVSGQLSYYACHAWCGAGRGRVLAVDRAPLRHKRDNKLRSRPPPRRRQGRHCRDAAAVILRVPRVVRRGRGRVLAVDRAPLRHKRDNKLRSRPPPPPPGGATAGMQRVSVSGQLSYYACHAWCGAGRGRVLAVDRAPLRHKRDNKLRSRPPPPPPPGAPLPGCSGLVYQLSYYACHAWCGAGRGRVLAVDRAPLRHKRDNKLRSRPPPPGAPLPGCSGLVYQLSYYACHAWCGAGRGRVLAVDRAPLRHKRDNKLRSRPPPPPPPGGATAGMQRVSCHTTRATRGAARGAGRVLAVDRAPLRHKRDNKLRSRPPPPGGATAGMQRVSVSGQLSYYACHAWCGAGRGRVLAVDRAPLRHKRDNKLRSRPPPPGGATAGMQRVSVSGQLSYYACHAWCGAGRGRVLAVDRAPLRHKRDNKLRSRPPPPGGATAGMQRVSVSGQLSYYACHAWCGAGRGRVLAVDRAPLRHKRDNKLRSRPAAARGRHCRDAAAVILRVPRVVRRGARPRAGRGPRAAAAQADNKLRSRPPPPGGATAGMQRVSVSGQLSYYACHAWCGAGRGRVLAVDRAPLRHKRDNKLRSRPPRRRRQGAPLPGCSGLVYQLSYYACHAWCGAGRGRVLAVDRAPLRHKRDNKLRSRPPPPPPPGGATAGMQRVSVSGQLSYYACHAWCGAGRGRVLAVDRAPLRHKRDNKLRSRPPPPGGATAGMQRVSVSGQLSYYACHAWCGAGRGRVLAVDRAPLRHKRDNKLRSRPPPPPPPGGATAGMQRVSVSGQLSYYACHAWCGAGRGRVLAVDRAPLRHKRDNKLRSRPPPPGGATAGMQRVSVSGQLSYYACHAWCGAGRGRVLAVDRAPLRHKRDNKLRSRPPPPPPPGGATAGMQRVSVSGQLSYYACHAWCGAGRGRVLAVDRAPLRHKRDNKLRSRPPPPPPPGGATAGMQRVSVSGQLSYYACHAWCGAGRGRVLAVDRAPLRHKRDNKLRSRPPPPPPPGGATAGMQRVSVSGQLSYYACHAWCGAGRGRVLAVDRAPLRHKRDNKLRSRPPPPPPPGGATAGMQRVSVSGQLSYYACHAWCGAGRGRVLAVDRAPLRHKRDNKLRSRPPPPPPPGGATAGMQRVSVSGQLSYYACHAWCGAGRGRVLAVDRAPLRHKRDNKLRSRPPPPPPPGGATAGMQRVSVSGQLSYYACHAWCGAGRGRVLAVDRAPLRHKRDNKLRSRPPPPPPGAPLPGCSGLVYQLSYYACHAWCGAGRGRVLAVDRAPLRHKRDNKLRSRPPPPPPPGGATAGMQRVSVSGQLSYYACHAWCGAGRGRVLAVDRAPLRHKRDNKLRSRPPPPPPPGAPLPGCSGLVYQLSYYACHAWCGAGRGRVLAVDRAPLRHKRDNKLRSRPPPPPPPGGATAGMQRENDDDTANGDTNQTNVTDMSDKTNSKNQCDDNKYHIREDNGDSEMKTIVDRSKTTVLTLKDETRDSKDVALVKHPSDTEGIDSSNATEDLKMLDGTKDSEDSIMMQDEAKPLKDGIVTHSTEDFKVQDGARVLKDAVKHVRSEAGAGAGTGGEVASRLRADLAHLSLAAVPAVAASAAVVGIAKHLCGVATDYALRCVAAPDVLEKTRGIVLATCCHHRCELAPYVGTSHLQELGIDATEFNIMLGVVSWATCGDGRSRQRRAASPDSPETPAHPAGGATRDPKYPITRAERSAVGARAKALLDLGRVRWLRARGLRARLARFVPPGVSPENLCIVARRD